MGNFSARRTSLRQHRSLIFFNHHTQSTHGCLDRRRSSEKPKRHTSIADLASSRSNRIASGLRLKFVLSSGWYCPWQKNKTESLMTGRKKVTRKNFGRVTMFSCLLQTILGMNPVKGASKLVYMDAIGSDPTQPRKIPDPYSLHTGFNPSTSGFFQQHLEDCACHLQLFLHFLFLNC